MTTREVVGMLTLDSLWAKIAILCPILNKTGCLAVLDNAVPAGRPVPFFPLSLKSSRLHVRGLESQHLGLHQMCDCINQRRLWGCDLEISLLSFLHLESERNENRHLRKRDQNEQFRSQVLDVKGLRR